MPLTLVIYNTSQPFHDVLSLFLYENGSLFPVYILIGLIQMIELF